MAPRRQRADKESASSRAWILDPTLASLFDAPPEQFIAVRDALAKEAQERGDKGRAQGLKALPKPTAVIWAINQAAHRRPERVRALIQAVARLGRDQGGDASPEELRTAMNDLREATSAVVQDSKAVLSEAHHAANAAVVLRIEATLRSSAIGSPEDRAALQAGRLMREIRRFGFPGSVEVLADSRDSARAAPRAMAASQVGREPGAREEDLQRREERKIAARKAAALAALKTAERISRSLEATARRASADAVRKMKLALRTEERAGVERAEANVAQQSAAEAKQKAAEAARRVVLLKSPTS